MKTAVVSPLTRYGMAYRLLGGIQIDIATAPRIVDGVREETSACNLNCTRVVGGYDCNSAISHNRGLVPSFASAPAVLSWIGRAAEGLFMLRDSGHMERLLERLPGEPPLSQAYKEGILALYHDPSAKVEVNLFGGSPSMNPAEPEVRRTLLSESIYTVNVTDHGAKLLMDRTYREDFLEHPPHLVAFSLDDVTLEEFRRLAVCDTDELRIIYRNVPWDNGQQKKAIAAIGAARICQANGGPPVLFNMVLHPGNIGEFFELTSAVRREFPVATINPFPAQSSFDGGMPIFQESELPTFEEIVDAMINQTLSVVSGFSKRLHYWLFLKACFTAEHTRWLLSGYNAWRCYQQDAGRYIQIGKGPIGRTLGEQDIIGGRLGCYWNNATVTSDLPLESHLEAVAYVQGGMTSIAQKSGAPCPGCVMPRLVYDLPNLMAGMNSQLVQPFIALMQKHAAGF